jgi:hypothetical protein
MKKIGLYVLFACVALLQTSCEKINEALEFTIPYDSKVTVSPTLGINTPFELLTPDIQTNAETIFSSKGTSKDLIESIKLSTFSINVITPSNQKLDFLKSVELTLSADGLSDLKVAAKDNIADGLSELSLDLVENNLLEYLKKDKFKIKAKIVTDKTITQEVQIGLASKFTVRAKLL